MTVRAVVLARAKFASFGGKTANDLVIYNGRLFDVVAIIDPSKAGHSSKEFLPIADSNVPIVGSLTSAMRLRPNALVIGVAPIGGKLDIYDRRIVMEAIKNGLDVWSGMHAFLTDDRELISIAKKSGATLHDLRHPPEELRIWSGEVCQTKAARITIMGTDCDVGKNITTMELARQADEMGFNPGIVATGQTMLMLGSDSGAVIDAIPADFTSGEVERQILKLDQAGRDLIFVEGQGAILHPAYGQVSLSILYGSQPDVICLAHDPFRRLRAGFNVKMPKLTREITAIETLCPSTKVVAISIMGWDRSDDEISRVARKIEKGTGITSGDVMTEGGRLTKAILRNLRSTKRISNLNTERR